ncbi:MAG TPA: glucan 1,4-alpha-glucosidase [Stellaceae bacterium]|nr:glucan 1,4-alpha-glucosidase [Stellaceae bacterium]
MTPAKTPLVSLRPSLGTQDMRGRVPSGKLAPGAPGIEPRWTSSAKTGVGTAPGSLSRVWFTLSHGILNEVYYPRVDQACIRDMGLIVTSGLDFLSEEKRDADHAVRYLAPGAPAFHLTNTTERYRIDKRVVTDPMRDVVLQHVTFTALRGTVRDYRLYALIAPHLVNAGADNTAWVADQKGIGMLFAQGGAAALALASSAGWVTRSVGFVGETDGWRELEANRQLMNTWSRAEHGNVAMIAEIDIAAAADGVVLALGFGRQPSEAGHRAIASLQDGFDAALAGYVAGWRAWQAPLLALDQPAKGDTTAEDGLYRISTAVLRSHAADSFPGGVIASLSIPWGFNKGDEDLGGYHLVWPRDLVETAGGFLAAGALDDARRVLNYLQATQEPDGGWPQNSWLDGTPYWTGIQLDESAFPILLVDLAQRCGALGPGDMTRYWPMVRDAAAFIIRNGPVTGQDRWEEDGGFSPFTIAVEIAGLLVAADLAELNHAPDIALHLRETADCWNADIERWMYVSGTELAQDLGIDGYYVRIASPDTADAASPIDGFVPIKNRPPADSVAPAAQIISPDALALVRFGLRAADDPRLRDTVTAIDARLKLETPAGPYWRRYTGDGYGEHPDGSPFDGTGIGRAWPLLTGERAHYELAAGRDTVARALLATLEASANPGGMLPEQIWDGPDIPERELFFGRPTGSAMPLVWAHAEHIKLLRSLRDGRVFDMPPQTVQRYQVDRVTPRLALWSFSAKRRTISHGRAFRIEVLASATVHWSIDHWTTTTDCDTIATGLGTHIADLPTEALPVGTQVIFTFRWHAAHTWEGADYSVTIE